MRNYIDSFFGKDFLKKNEEIRMRKKCSFLIATGIFLLLLVPSIGIADIDEDKLAAGDTFIYSVTKFNAPWQDIIPAEQPPFNMFDMGDLVLDLSGSTLAVKVMGVDADGYYSLNGYVILGKTIEIPFPNVTEGIPIEIPLTDNVTAEITDVFGDTFQLPAGVGIGVAAPIPYSYGSDLLELYDDGFDDFPGIPFYLDPGEWNEYEAMLKDLETDLTGRGINIDVDVTSEGDEFAVDFDTGQVPTPVGNIEFQITVVWHRTGPFAGVFKSILGSIEVAASTFEVEISFEKKRHNPLPQEIIDEETISLKMLDGSLDYNATGFLLDQKLSPVITTLTGFEDNLADAVNETIVEYDITSVRGCYYRATQQSYDANTQTLKTVEDDLWRNGFLGFPQEKILTSGPWSSWSFNFSVGLVPVIAPGITPDWDMWLATAASISTIQEFVETTINSDDAKAAYADMGMVFNTFDLLAEFRGDEDYRVFFYEGSVDFEIDTRNMLPEYDPPTDPFNATLILDAQGWMAYTSEGLLAGMGADVVINATLGNVPLGEESWHTAPRGTGNFSLGVNIELKNDAIKESLPDPEALPEYTEKETKEVTGDGDGITPGFSFIPALILITAIAIVIKRRK